MTILSNITLFLIGWAIGFILGQLAIRAYYKKKRTKFEHNIKNGRYEG